MNQRQALAAAEFGRVLHYLLNVHGMDVDDALDWIEEHCPLVAQRRAEPDETEVSA